MKKRTAALVVSGMLVAGPIAFVALSAGPAAGLPVQAVQHSDHDGHGHRHGHHHRGHGDSAHASGGYDHHRRHPRD